jgi:hypothetical protein
LGHAISQDCLPGLSTNAVVQGPTHRRASCLWFNVLQLLSWILIILFCNLHLAREVPRDNRTCSGDLEFQFKCNPFSYCCLGRVFGHLLFYNPHPGFCLTPSSPPSPCPFVLAGIWVQGQESWGLCICTQMASLSKG